MSTEPPETSAATSRPVRRRALAAGLTMAVTVNAFEAMAVTTVMPTITADLDGDRLYGASFSVFMLASLVALVAGGEVADRRGPALPFTIGVLAMAIGLVVVGTARAMPVVVAGRALQGLGSGTVATIAYVAIGRAWPPERMARMFAVLSAAWIVPSLVGPAAAGAVADELDWRWVFLGLLPLLPVLMALALPSLARLGPPVGRPGPRRVPDAARLALGATLAVGGLQSANPVALAALAVAGTAVAARPLVRLLPPGTLRAAPGLAALIAARFAVNVAFFGADTLIPLAASRLHDASAVGAGIVIVGASLAWSLGSAHVARSRADRSPSKTMRTGFLVMAVAIAASVTVVVSSVPLWLTFLTWALAGFGIGLVFTTTSTSAMQQASSGNGEGVVGSQLGIADALGFAVATAVGGALVGAAERTSLTLPAAIAGAFALSWLAALVGAAIARRTHRAAAAAGVPSLAPASGS